MTDLARIEALVTQVAGDLHLMSDRVARLESKLGLTAERSPAYAFTYLGAGYPKVGPTEGEVADETGKITDRGQRFVQVNPRQGRYFPVVDTTEPKCPVAPGFAQLDDSPGGVVYFFAGRGHHVKEVGGDGLFFTEKQMASWPEHLRFPVVE